MHITRSSHFELGFALCLCILLHIRPYLFFTYSTSLPHIPSSKWDQPTDLSSFDRRASRILRRCSILRSTLTARSSHLLQQFPAVCIQSAQFRSMVTPRESHRTPSRPPIAIHLAWIGSPYAAGRRRQDCLVLLAGVKIVPFLRSSKRSHVPFEHIRAERRRSQERQHPFCPS